MKRMWTVWLLVCLSLVGYGQEREPLPASTEHLLIEMVPMRDGVKLFTTIELPEAGKQYPVMLIRNLYRGRSVKITEPKGVEKRNHVIVHQDVRGAGRSEGDWRPFVQEVDDGKDCLDWIAKQPWCNGKIAMKGASYLGNTQFLAAASGHPALLAISPEVIAFDYFTPIRQQGCVPPLAMAGWAFVCIAHNLGLSPLKIHPNPNPQTTAWSEFDMKGIGQRVPFWQAMMSPEGYEAYWKGLNGHEIVDKIRCPAYLLSGWYDIDASAELNLFMAMRTHGATEAVRKFTHCVMGPYTHGGVASYPGMTETSKMRRQKRDLLNIFSLNLMNGGTKEPLPQLQPLMYYVMGVNEWRGATCWPPEGTTVVPYYLGGGKANTAAGNGTVSTVQADTPDDVFISDPTNPVPTVGGRWEGNAREQLEPLGKRQDVLFYQTAPLTAPLEIAGPVKARLFFTCNTPETDIAVKLADVHPDGKAYNIVNGIKRTTTRSNGPAMDAPMVPGQVYELSFEIQSTAHRFLPGHRLMVIIAGQEFGYFTFNRNTGKGSADVECRQAEIHILHTAQHPSAILLPTQDVSAVKAVTF